MKPIKIESHVISPNDPPFIVAELSGNHQGSYERLVQLVDAAQASGAHAVKLQTYTPDTITLDIHTKEFMINDPQSLWAGRSLFDLYQEAHTPWEWHAPIFEYCKKIGITVFSTPFDETAVDFLEKLNVPCYKIASLEIVDLPLIRKAASTGKPIILSTGAATVDEIQEAVQAARDAGCKDLILLKCTAAYPANPADMNLRTIPNLSERFNVLAGLSDHSLGIGVAVASVALGACFIEKHLTMHRSEGGVDSAFSMEPSELKSLVVETKRAWQALGKVCYEPQASEKGTWLHRPSLYFVEDLNEGTLIEARHLRTVRPGAGLPPKELPKLLGKKLLKAVKKGTPAAWDLVTSL
jgi:pseudaminic acid synthase